MIDRKGGKLDASKVREIRAARGVEKQEVLALLHRVSQVMISRVQLRKAWKHVQ